MTLIHENTDENAQQEGPLRNVAHWGAKTIFHTKADEKIDFVGKIVYEISEITREKPLGYAGRYRHRRRLGNFVRQSGE